MPRKFKRKKKENKKITWSLNHSKGCQANGSSSEYFRLFRIAKIVVELFPNVTEIFHINDIYLEFSTIEKTKRVPGRVLHRVGYLDFTRPDPTRGSGRVGLVLICFAAGRIGVGLTLIFLLRVRLTFIWVGFVLNFHSCGSGSYWSYFSKDKPQHYFRSLIPKLNSYVNYFKVWNFFVTHW